MKPEPWVIEVRHETVTWAVESFACGLTAGILMFGLTMFFSLARHPHERDMPTCFKVGTFVLTPLAALTGMLAYNLIDVRLVP